MERGWPPKAETSPTCPRCGSSNTKFCYYNNYSLTQPRYFCKGCRRYWTKGGSLRHVPVGGRCRKSRRGKPSRNGNPSRGFSGGQALLGHNEIIPIMSNTSFAAAAEGSNIDLASVYANFLSQNPGPEAGTEPHDPHIGIPIMHNAVGGPSFDQFSSLEEIHMGLMNDQLLSQESSFVEYSSLSDRPSDTHFNDANAFYFPWLESIEKQHTTDCQLSSSGTNTNQMNSYVLPPLTGEELTSSVSEGMVWPGSDQIIFPRDAFQANEISGRELQTQEPNKLDENGSQFNESIKLCDVLKP